MNYLNLNIPRRLKLLTNITGLSLVISMLMSWPLWSADTFYPDDLVIPSLSVLSDYSAIFSVFSILLILISLVHERQRLFIFLAIICNVLLVLLDFNRMQPWFYIYNLMLFVLIFYNGRVDNSTHFTSIFICLQLIAVALYLYNGIGQLSILNLQNEITCSLSAWQSKLSGKQYQFLLNSGKVLPIVQLICGAGLLIKPIRFIVIPLSLLFHFSLLVFLFPFAQNHNYALWFMNFFFILNILVLFSGKTEARYFSNSILLQKPLFYLIILIFCAQPFLMQDREIKRVPGFLLRPGISSDKYVLVSELDYSMFPNYVKAFCRPKNGLVEVELGRWCRHELLSDPISSTVNVREINKSTSLANVPVVKESEDMLSSLR